MPVTITTNAIDSPTVGEHFTLQVTWRYTLPASFVGIAQITSPSVVQTNSTLPMRATSGATGTSSPVDPGPTTIDLPGSEPAVDMPFQSGPVDVTFTRSDTGAPVVLSPGAIRTTWDLVAAVSLNLACTPANVTPLTLTDQPPTAPAAPTIAAAAASDRSATMSWVAPFDGGSPIVGYVVTAYVGYYPAKYRIFNSTSTTQTVTGLSNGTHYRFRVRAYNTIGISGYSRVANLVTPTA